MFHIHFRQNVPKLFVLFRIIYTECLYIHNKKTLFSCYVFVNCYFCALLLVICYSWKRYIVV